MSPPKLNQQIIKVIKQKTENELGKRQFIIETLFEEIKHPGHWHFKEYYKKKIRAYNKEGQK